MVDINFTTEIKELKQQIQDMTDLIPSTAALWKSTTAILLIIMTKNYLSPQPLGSQNQNQTKLEQQSLSIESTDEPSRRTSSCEHYSHYGTSSKSQLIQPIKEILPLIDQSESNHINAINKFNDLKGFYNFLEVDIIAVILMVSRNHEFKESLRAYTTKGRYHRSH